MPILLYALECIRSVQFSYKQRTCLSRRDSVLLNRLRIGHTRLTHSFLLSGDDLPECGTCQCPLVQCVDLNNVRNKHFVASSIKYLFDYIEAHKSLFLLKKLVFISNFNVFILMFIICFFYSSLIALILHS